MCKKLEQKWEELKEYLDMIPVEQNNSFRLESVNDRDVKCKGLLHNSEIRMDWVVLESSAKTRWVIQDCGITFMMNRGVLEIRFRLNDTIHSKFLRNEQSVRIPKGVPFQLITYEESCSVLLISSGDSDND